MSSSLSPSGLEELTQETETIENDKNLLLYFIDEESDDPKDLTVLCTISNTNNSTSN